jgi:hypothetical protein
MWCMVRAHSHFHRADQRHVDARCDHGGLVARTVHLHADLSCLVIAFTFCHGSVSVPVVREVRTPTMKWSVSAGVGGGQCRSVWFCAWQRESVWVGVGQRGSV